ncbi:TonB family protein [Flavihumibacter rivuli]|uniref:energy transducer TonB n=1 Tax=Flavihumibacter rivuli TaxID=2838156 RepID=UPI001BDE910A|nr:energy transducer TonB [Flavihumibacter rivuli]ULQ55194.1 TonB family protein [Flavihumibacter rivuli]
MRLLTILLLTLFLQTAHAQDTTYLDINGEKVIPPKPYHWKKVTKRSASNPKEAEVFYYIQNGELERKFFYENLDSNILGGKYLQYYPGGQIYMEQDIRHNQVEGNFIVYYKNGKVRRSESYKNGKMITGTCYDSTGKEIAYFPHETLPSFPGGNSALAAFLGRELKYPNNARRAGIEERILVRFEVDKEGNIKNPRIYKGVDPELSAEALRVVNKMPQWIPGQQDGQPKIVTYQLPVVFKLQ